MALSGTINGSVTNKSQYFSFYISWSATQNVEGNYSDVTVKTYWKTNNTYQTFDTVGSRNASITINGTTKSISKVFSVYWSSNPYLIQSETVRVYHNDDGTKSITISARANGHAKEFGTSSSTASSADCTASGTITLNTIPRKATVSAVTNFNDEGNPTVTFTNLGGFNLMPYINVYKDGAIFHSINRSKGKYTSPYTFSITDAERTALRNACNTNSSYSVTIGVETYNGNTNLGYDSKVATLTIVNANPSTTMTLSPVDCPSWAYVDSKPIYIQGVTKVGATFTNTLKKGATLKSNALTVEGYTDSTSAYQSNILTGSGTINVSGKVTDSRGLSSTVSKNITVVSYANPYVAYHSQYDRIICGRCDENGNLANSGTSLKVIIGKKWSPLTNNTNKATLQYLVETTGYSSGWKTLSANTEGTNGTFNIDTVVSGVTLDVDKAYTVTFKCIDTFGNYTTTPVKIPMEDVAFHLREGGSGAAFGKYAEDSKLLDVAWKTKISDTTFKLLTLKLVGSTNGSTINFQNDAGSLGFIGMTGNAVNAKLKRWNTDASTSYTVLDTESVKDYVTAQGTSNGWTYTKWNSGRAEAWQNVDLGTVALTKSMAGGVYSADSYVARGLNFPSGLFTATPLAFINAYSNGYTISQVASCSTTQLVYRIWSPYSATVEGCTVSLYVIGKWK